MLTLEGNTQNQKFTIKWYPKEAGEFIIDGCEVHFFDGALVQEIYIDKPVHIQFLNERERLGKSLSSRSEQKMYLKPFFY